MTYAVSLFAGLIPGIAAHRAGLCSVQGSGVANNGIRLDGPAPVDDILAAHTIAPFDDCGDHVNTHVGYHYHAVTDCLEGAIIGNGIFSQLLLDGSAPDNLDKYNGHEVNENGYHYHAGAAGSNAILACLSAEAGCASEGRNRTCDASAMPPRL